MKELFVNEEKLREISGKFGTPFHLYYEKGLRENARALKEAFSWNPGFKEYFAVKANPNPSLLKILKEEGFAVDCATGTELLLVDKLGFKRTDIMFSSNVTPAEDFRLARKLDAYINLDDISHIDYLEKFASIPETISLRFNPGGEFKIANTIMGNPGDAKYGLTRNQMAEGILRLMDKGAKYFGLHSFLASNNLANEYYPEIARILFQLAVDLHKETSAEFKFINLSGGIGIPYLPEDKKVDIHKVGTDIKAHYEDILVSQGMGDIKIFTELGRFIMGPYGCLVSTVLHLKETYKKYVGLDSCAADLMRPAIYGAYHHISVLGKEKLAHDKVYDVTGGLCENNDKFAIDRKLPEIEIGDLLVIHDTGAHGYSMGYNYNGKLRAKEILLKEDGTSKLIRRAERPEDYFATMIFD